MNDASTSTILWRGMNRAELDVAYNNSLAVPDGDKRRDGWIARSVEMRKKNPELLDLAYGPRERNRLDVFRSGKTRAPLFVLIHGGYWQRNHKDMFACMAEGPISKGFDVAVIGYTLCPEVTLTELVAETHAAIRWLRKEGPSRGVGEGKLVVSGWSAGGHLTASALGLDEVDAGLAISGIYDLEPMRLSYINDKLRLDEAEELRNSPARNGMRFDKPLMITYGTVELAELQRQSTDFSAIAKTMLLPLKHNHFTILEELASPDGMLTKALLQALL